MVRYGVVWFCVETDGLSPFEGCGLPFEMLVKLSRALGQSSALRVDESLQVRAQTLGASKSNEMTAQ